MRVRAISCRACGGAKVSPSKTAYIYCDYCGCFMEWDFYRAVAAKNDRLPGPEYERLCAELGPKTEAAKAAGDAAAYRALQRQIFDAHMNGCPASYSPRLGDPAYRAALLDYTADYYTLIGLDPELQALDIEVNQAMAALQWKERKDPGPAPLIAELEDYRDLIMATAQAVQAKSTFFWRLFEAFDAFTKRAVAKAEQAGLFERYPDEVDPSAFGKTGYAIFAEAWLPYLKPDDQQRLLELTGLSGSYREVDASALAQRHCGRCGSELAIPEGAHTVVCEGCGHKIDVGKPEFFCGNCGGPVSSPIGFSAFPCPYCEAEIRALM